VVIEKKSPASWRSRGYFPSMVTRSIADRDAADARRLDVAMTGIPKGELANAVKKLHQDRVVSFIAGIFEIVSCAQHEPPCSACLPR
jgi:hypothetical protein